MGGFKNLLHVPSCIHEAGRTGFAPPRKRVHVMMVRRGVCLLPLTAIFYSKWVGDIPLFPPPNGSALPRLYQSDGRPLPRCFIPSVHTAARRVKAKVRDAERPSPARPVPRSACRGARGLDAAGPTHRHGGSHRRWQQADAIHERKGCGQPWMWRNCQWGFGSADPESVLLAGLDTRARMASHDTVRAGATTSGPLPHVRA